jgi:hypothetical protein
MIPMTSLNYENSEHSDFLTTEQVANLYPMYTVSTLKTLRYRGKSPFPYYKIDRKVVYKRSEIEEVLGSSKVEPNTH